MAAVLKTAMGRESHRGFESHTLRSAPGETAPGLGTCASGTADSRCRRVQLYAAQSGLVRVAVPNTCPSAGGAPRRPVAWKRDQACPTVTCASADPNTSDGLRPARRSPNGRHHDLERCRVRGTHDRAPGRARGPAGGTPARAGVVSLPPESVQVTSPRSWPAPLSPAGPVWMQ